MQNTVMTSKSSTKVNRLPPKYNPRLPPTSAINIIQKKKNVFVTGGVVVSGRNMRFFADKSKETYHMSCIII